MVSFKFRPFVFLNLLLTREQTIEASYLSVQTIVSFAENSTVQAIPHYKLSSSFSHL